MRETRKLRGLPIATTENIRNRIINGQIVAPDGVIENLSEITRVVEVRE